MKAIEQFFPVVLFIILCKVVLTLNSALNEILQCDHSCNTVPYAVQGGSYFDSVIEILKCNHSYESY